MRLLTSFLLSAGFAGPAIAHTGNGSTLEALSHQLVGLHHLPFSLVALAAVVFVIGCWHICKRAD